MMSDHQNREEFEKTNREVPELPQELLVKIFSYYVESEGVGKLLSCLAKVSRKWCSATSSLTLYRVVDDPLLAKGQFLKLFKKGQLSLVRELNLSHFAHPLDKKDLAKVLSNCHNIKRLDLSNNVCSNNMFELVGINCPALESLRLEQVKAKNTALNVIQPILDSCGAKLKYLNLSNTALTVNSQLLVRISEVCHSLEELHLTNNAGVLRCPIGKLQNGCPRLRTLELGSCEYICNKAAESCGFKNLIVFRTGIVDWNGPRDKELGLILRKSTELRELDVRGCSVTGRGLLNIPSDKLERLYLSRTPVLCSKDLFLVIDKWKYTLKDLDFSRMLDEALIAGAFRALLKDNPNPVLEKIDLTASVVSERTIMLIWNRFQNLEHLNVESCRELPRGAKRMYQSRSQLRHLFDILADGDTESEDSDSYSQRKLKRPRKSVSYRISSDDGDESNDSNYKTESSNSDKEDGSSD